MTSSRREMSCRGRRRFSSSAGTRRLLLAAFLVFSAIRKSASQLRQTAGSTPSGGTMMADQSLLDLYVVEGLPAGYNVGSIPRDMGFNQKYSSSELSELRYSLLSKPVVGSEVGSPSKAPLSLSGLSSSSSSNFERPLFAVDELSGTISTADKLDREALCRRLTEPTSSFTVSPCIVRFDVAVRPMTQFRIIRVRVEILDVNDNEPTFPVGSIVLALPETAAPGTSLHLPVAADADSGVNGVRQYSLETAVDAFKLVERSRNDIRLVVTSPLDRELIAEYRLMVVAVDGGEPSRSGTLQIAVTVVDSNDNAPRFTVFNSSYSGDVSEDAVPGTVLLVVRATDADSGPNAHISYSLAPDRSSPRDLADLFAIGETSGELYTLAPLDRETESVYRMYVVATDRPETEVALSAIASVEIRVTDVNDHAPRIRINSPTLSAEQEAKNVVANWQGVVPSEAGNSTMFAISPDSPVGTFICHLTVEDLDSGENGRFACRLLGPAATKFQLHRMYQTEFKVVTSARLNVNHATGSDGNEHDDISYDFTIVCRDFGSPVVLTSTLPVSVKLISSADSHRLPLTCVRDPYHVTIAESSDVGLTIIQPETLVVQTGSELKYRLNDDESVGENVADLVAVNTLSGLVTTRVPLDREREGSFRFSVIVSDGGSRTVSCRVHVTVSDTNDNRPVFVFPVPGNDTVIFRVGSPSTDVARVSAIDADSPGHNSDIAYSISLPSSTKIAHESEGVPPEFTVDSRSGVVKFIPGDRILLNSRKKYDVRVVATDHGSPTLTAEAILKILITDLDEPGQQRRSTSGTVTASGEHGSQLLTLLLIGSLVIVFVAIIVIIVVVVVATADRRRRGADCDKNLSRQADTKEQHPPSKVDQKLAHDDDVIGHLPSAMTTSILHSSRQGNTNCNSQHPTTPTKKVVIFVKDVMTPSGPDCDQQVAPPCHVMLSSGPGTPRSPDSDDSGRGRSSEDGTGVDAGQVATSGGHNCGRLAARAEHPASATICEALQNNGDGKSMVVGRTPAERVVIDVCNSYPSVSTMPSSSTGSHLNVPDSVISAEDWAQRHQQRRHDPQQPLTDKGVVSNTLEPNDTRRRCRVDYCNPMRRTPSLSSSIALSAVDYRSWLTDSTLENPSDATVITSSGTADGRRRSGTISTSRSIDNHQQYHQPQQRASGVTSYSNRGIDIVAMRPFSTLISRRGSALDDRRRVFVERSAGSSSSLSTASNCYTLPRRERIWPVSGASTAGTSQTHDTLLISPTVPVEQAATATAGARVIHRQTPGIRCIISGDGSVVYRSSVAPPADWVRTKIQRPTVSPSGECVTKLHAPTGIAKTGVRQRQNDSNGNEPTATSEQSASSVDTVI